MYNKYLSLCNDRLIDIGKLWLYKAEDKWILNFPTKIHWKDKSELSYLHLGLQKFVQTYKEKSITTAAFPILGSGKGGIPIDISISIMQQYLKNCDLEIEIYQYDTYAHDDVFLNFKQLWLDTPEKELAYITSIRIEFVRKVKSALLNEDIKNMNQLLSTKGIGEETLEKSFRFLKTYQAKPKSNQFFK